MAGFQLPLPARVLLDQVNELHAEARRQLKAARREAHESQSEFLRLYHILEVLPNFNAAEGYRIAKRLQEVLIRRRQAKWDVETWEAVVQYIDASQSHFHRAYQKVSKRNEHATRYVTEGPTEGQIEEAAAAD